MYFTLAAQLKVKLYYSLLLFCNTMRINKIFILTIELLCLESQESTLGDFLFPFMTQEADFDLYFNDFNLIILISRSDFL